MDPLLQLNAHFLIRLFGIACGGILVAIVQAWLFVILGDELLDTFDDSERE